MDLVFSVSSFFTYLIGTIQLKQECENYTFRRKDHTIRSFNFVFRTFKASSLTDPTEKQLYMWVKNSDFSYSHTFYQPFGCLFKWGRLH